MRILRWRQRADNGDSNDDVGLLMLNAMTVIGRIAFDAAT
jgi:hypothetical protein